MKGQFSISKISAWCIIFLWLTRAMIFRVLHIDFASVEIGNSFRQVWLILIPLAVGALVVATWKMDTSRAKRVMGLSAAMVVSAGLIVMLQFFDFCVWSFSEPIYRSRSGETEIKQRVHNCGAWDSDPLYQLVETKAIGRYLVKYSEVRKEDIDEVKWIKE